jgi:hypothetical protein
MRRRLKRILAALGLAALVAEMARRHRQRRDASGRLWWEEGEQNPETSAGADRPS